MKWRGGFGYGNSTNSIAGFTVTFYSSIGGNSQPNIATAPPLATYTVSGNPGQTSAGTVGGYPMYDYDFVLPTPFQAVAGTVYWIQIEASQAGIPDWCLAGGSGGNGSYFKQFAYVGDKFFLMGSGDAAFTLLTADTAIYSVAASATPTASGIIAGAGLFPTGVTASLAATPATNFAFVNWTEKRCDRWFVAELEQFRRHLQPNTGGKFRSRLRNFNYRLPERRRFHNRRRQLHQRHESDRDGHDQCELFVCKLDGKWSRGQHEQKLHVHRHNEPRSGGQLYFGGGESRDRVFAAAAAQCRRDSTSYLFPDGIDGDGYAYDNFTLATTQNITQIKWLGGYRYGLSASNPSFDFIISIYTNVYTAPVASYDVGGNANETPAGGYFSYSFTLPGSFHAVAGTTYWVQIEAQQTAYINDWGMAYGAGGDGVFYLSGNTRGRVARGR